MDARISVKGALGIVVLMLSTSGFAQAAGAANGGGDDAASGSVHTDTTTAVADRKLEKDVHYALGKTKHLTSRDIRFTLQLALSRSLDQYPTGLCWIGLLKPRKAFQASQLSGTT
ncbi:hypothetical protein SAMN05192544_11363 [Paraburkholderia hospita]|nr:hypothetical protein SAMN05192544_11363 [Paraburkholderia hospita]